MHNSNAVLVLAGSRFHINQLNELDVSPADIARLDSHEHHEQLSAELRFAGETDTFKFNVQAGKFYTIEVAGGICEYICSFR